MPRAERTLEPALVEAQGSFGRLPDGCHTHDEEVVMSEHEVFAPAIVPRIEEADQAPPNGAGDLLLLVLIAERAAPGEVVQMSGPARSGTGRTPRSWPAM